MPKILTQQQIDTFWRDGCVFPVRVMSEAEALRDPRASSRRSRATAGGPLKGDLRHKSHLLFPWLGDLVRNDRIVDAIEDLYGPNLLCWTTNFFIKEANNPAFVSWHQDSTYWGLDKPDVVTAWVAFTPSNEANGAMGFIPGTHTARPDPAPRHLRQEQPADARPGGRRRRRPSRRRSTIELEPGEMSLHHVRLVHGSPPNPSNDRRIGFAIRYIPTSVAQIAGEDSATLVRGVDAHPPLRARAAARRATWTRRSSRCTSEIAERNAQILYRGTDGEELQRPGGVAGAGRREAAGTASPRRGCSGRCTSARRILVIANAWDAGSARVFEDAGIRAIGTGSAGVAFSHGFVDDERIRAT